MTTVVNKRTDKYDVYCGRGSIWGNNYTHIKDRETKAQFIVGSREESIEKFRVDFEDRVENDPEFRAETLKLRGRILGCYCKPLSCHVDIIANWVDSQPIEYLPINEGIDHINIYSKSALPLGRMLTNFAHTPFICEGETFQSVEGYWYWLKTGGKFAELKELHGIAAKKYGQNLAAEKVEVPNFNDKILEAIRCKLRQHKDIRIMLKQSILPLTHYYYFGNIEKPTSIVRLPQYDWIVNEFERLRELLKK